MDKPIRLSSGRLLTANEGYISINEDLEIADGYDGGLAPVVQESWMEPGAALTKEECIELGERMIGLWQKFVAKTRGE